MQKILLLDIFDSFTYNLVDAFRQLGCSVKVYRNTADPDTLACEDFDLLAELGLPLHFSPETAGQTQGQCRFGICSGDGKAGVGMQVELRVMNITIW